MVNRVMAVVACMAAVVLATGTLTAATPTEAGPVSLWNFDGTAKDAAGATADHLTPRGAARLRFVTPAELPGTSGKAVALGVKRGDAKHMTAAVSKDIRLGAAYTIEAWTA